MIYSTAEKFIPMTFQSAGTKGFSFWRTALFLVAEDYLFEWGQFDKRKRMFLRQGFVTDKASIPSGPILGTFARALGFLRDGPHETGSALHDALCRKDGEFETGVLEYWVQTGPEKWERDDSPWGKQQRNDFFNYVSVVGGENPVRSEVEEGAVNIFGGIHRWMTRGKKAS